MDREETIRRNIAFPVKTATMVLSIVGALNWGLVALFNFDLVEWAAGRRSVGQARGRHHASNTAARVVYGLVGLSGLVLALVPPLKLIGPVRRSIERPERPKTMAHTTEELLH